jgi:hypothetical protein
LIRSHDAFAPVAVALAARFESIAVAAQILSTRAGRLSGIGPAFTSAFARCDLGLRTFAAFPGRRRRRGLGFAVVLRSQAAGADGKGRREDQMDGEFHDGCREL